MDSANVIALMSVVFLSFDTIFVLSQNDDYHDILDYIRNGFNKGVEYAKLKKCEFR